jgi:pyruvate dehydrogenase E2 component (dihydrolipoamide acetyltransferase)
VDLARAAPTGPGGRVVAWNVQALAEGAAHSVPQPAASKVSPLARKVAADLGIDPAALVGAGPGGRVTRQDVERAAQRVQASAPPAPARTPPGRPGCRSAAPMR